MKLLKKMTCLALALTMLLTACAFAETTPSEGIPFVPMMMPNLDLTAEEWIEDEVNRTMATVLLFVESGVVLLEDYGDYMNNCLNNPSYIGRSGDILVVHMHGEAGDVSVFYEVNTGLAQCVLMESYPDAVVEAVMAENCPDGYYRNEVEDVQAAARALQEALDTH